MAPNQKSYMSALAKHQQIPISLFAGIIGVPSKEQLLLGLS
jgi:hypothetical protein